MKKILQMDFPEEEPFGMEMAAALPNPIAIYFNILDI